MNDTQRATFLAQLGVARKSQTTAILLTLFLGGVGAHRFYLGQIGLGVLYLVFFWTFIPAIVALFELIIIGRRVDRYNQQQAELIAANVRVLGIPATTDHRSQA